MRYPDVLETRREATTGNDRFSILFHTRMDSGVRVVPAVHVNECHEDARRRCLRAGTALV